MSKTAKAMLDSNVEGQLLIAMPGMSDDRFQRSVVFMCAHSDEGAMGLIINKPVGGLTFGKLIEQIDLFDGQTVAKLGRREAALPVYNGGPVESGRGFVLHSPDYFAEGATRLVEDEICLTQTTDILKAIARGAGPQSALFLLGYAGWAAGQLEAELGANGWLTCAANQELVLEAEAGVKYQRALSTLGVDPSHLVSAAGRA